ncbi:hypothetical protein P3X46_001739 [Hevea brasiliensis]|uniref:Glutamate receptor n=1 Tax=Hevea brasiliensis TaxID=3981 RepID=A0ABQ9NE90_HEVBR|nr:hypothetical protein P3X46_001739 [Hevea brasiliensis]
MMMRSNSKSVFSFFFFFFFFMFFSFTRVQNIYTSSVIPVNVGVIFDFDDWVGKMWWSCINMSLSDFYTTHSHYKTRLELHPRDSMKDVLGAAAAALDLIKNTQVQAILGPTTSLQANFIIELGEKARVPIISSSASSFSITSVHSSYFFRATQSDANQAQAISAIIQAFRWKEAVPIYVDNVFGERLIPYLTNALQAIGTRVSYWSAISPLASDEQIEEELYKLMTMEVRVFIVHLFPSLGSRFFTKVKQVGMLTEGYVWILSDGMVDLLSASDPSALDSMQGVLGVKPYVPNTIERENFRVQWKKNFYRDNPDMVDAELSINGLWAYDAMTALAMAVETAGTTSLSFQMANVTSNSTTCLESFGVSRHGPNLVQALSSISFRGLTGDFLFVNGQLQSSLFQVVNMNDEGARGVGFWTAGKGLVRKLNSSNNTVGKESPTSTSGLAPIIWPGDSTLIPKGMVMRNGRVLRVGVPVRNRFNQLVTVKKDPHTNIQTKIDAVVGDASILASRSYYVDYTMPFLESGGLSMIVPTQDHTNSKTWVFLKPLTWGVWITSICFFVFIGLVVWVLEHRINDDFQGPPLRQIGTSIWFSFSTMVFAHREKVISNLARIVVITWCFVGLVLTQSYAAALSSFLTVQQLNSNAYDLNELIQKRQNVGYQSGSSVRGFLKSLGFYESQLLPYSSAEECDQLLSKGNENGGIAVAIDEAPYLNIILAEHCDKYTMAESMDLQKYMTSGFGFVFSRGSSLVPDVSRAILALKENGEIKKLEDEWFGNASCSVRSDPVSNRLGLDSFKGLFLIAGMISVLALLTYMAMIAYENRQVLINPRISMLSRILDLLTIFQKYFSLASRKRGFNSPALTSAPGLGAPNHTVQEHPRGEQGVH